MERSEIRVLFHARIPDCAALHPGYERRRSELPARSSATNLDGEQLTSRRGLPAEAARETPKMADDATMVALINHSMIGETKPQRKAAGILLEVLRSSDGLDGFFVKFPTVE